MLPLLPLVSVFFAAAEKARVRTDGASSTVADRQNFHAVMLEEIAHAITVKLMLVNGTHTFPLVAFLEELKFGNLFDPKCQNKV